MLGGLSLAVVVVLGFSSSEFERTVFFKLNYSKPFFLTYFSCLLFSFYLSSFCIKKPTKEFTRLLVDSVQLGPVWFAANMCMSWSLALSIGGANTILGSLTGVVVLVMSIAFLKQSPDILKFVAAAASITGVLLIASEDNNFAQEVASTRDIVALAGVFFYACYSVLLKHKHYNEDIPHLFGLIGVVNSVLFLPVLLLLNSLGTEVFVMPYTLVFGYFLLAAITSSVILDILLAISISALSPVLCHLCLNLTVPLSLLYKSFSEDKQLLVVHLLGSLLVLAGFTLITLFENDRWAQKLTNASLWRALSCSSDTRALI